MSERFPGKIVIGLTGNIAVGKSLVLAQLAALGADTIDADQVAHDCLRRDGAAFDAVVAAFGADILGADGEICRQRLGALVFRDAARLRQLEAISHPPIRREILRRARESKARVVVIEAIKLLEGALKDAVAAVWVVNAAPATQLQRLQQARNLPEAEARRRIALQNSQADKLRQADVIIENDGDAAATRAQVERAWKQLIAAAR